MPEKTIVEGVYRVWPWLVGTFLSIAGVLWRNEWTTARMERTLYDKNGDLRLVKSEDCDTCRTKCQESYQASMDKEHKETREELQRINDKIDCLPKKVLALWKAAQ